MNYREVSPRTATADLVELICGLAPTRSDRWPLGFHKWENVQSAYRRLLHQAGRESEIRSTALSRIPSEKKGIGVVIYGGGKYSASAYVTIRAIRYVGYCGPIELFCLNANELDNRHVSLFSDLGVKCINAESIDDKRRIFGGWHLKPFALRHCGFRYVLAFDADCYPADGSVFKVLEKIKNQAFFLPDQPFGVVGDLSSETWRLLTGTPRRVCSFESGFIGLDTVKCRRELELTQWINDHSDYYYQHFWGDKESWSLAWNYLGTPYYQSSQRWCKVGPALLHYLDGKPLVVHRCEDKFTLETNRRNKSYFWTTPQPQGQNVFTPQLPLEFECWHWLKEYRDEIGQCEPAVCRQL